MYQMRARAKPNPHRHPQDFVAVAKGRTWDKWHRILGHISMASIKMLKNNSLVQGLTIDGPHEDTQCKACIQGKKHVEPFPKRSEDSAKEIGEITVSDVWGPAQIERPAREKYFYSFMDLKTRYSVIYFGSTKDEALKHFEAYKAMVETQTGSKLKRFRSDNGGEYINKPFKDFCAKYGILMETTAPYSPAQNGVAERLNRTLLEHARAMIYAKNLPKFIWPEAVAYACYIKNRSPTRALGAKTTPYQEFSGKKPDVSRLEEFGTRCWVMIPDQRRAKLDPKAEEHYFVGVAEHSKAWKFYNKFTRHVQISRNITFDESDTKLFPIPNEDESTTVLPLEGEIQAPERQSSQEPAPDTPQTTTAPTPDIAPTPDPAPQIRRSTRNTNRPDYRILNDPAKSTDRVFVSRDIIIEPDNYANAMASENAPIWMIAMKIEIKQHEEIGTWELVHLPTGRVAIGCRWVYAVKTQPDGTFEKAKARIVAQGFTQRPGMDYYEITSPVVKFNSLRTLLAIGNSLDWEIEMMDVKGAYLNSNLDEEIYMQQPEGFDDGTGRVLKLKKAIYGLKQAGRAWYLRLKTALTSTGFTQSTADECIYIKNDDDGIKVISVYVDDLGLFASSKRGMTWMKGELNRSFIMTDLGEMKKILGIRVERNREQGMLKISQGPYIDKVLNRFYMHHANPVTTPLSKNVKLTTPNEPTKLLNVPYAQAMGSIMYAALGSRPDLAFTIQHLSQFTTNHGTEHWTAVKHALRYLSGTRDAGVVFRKTDKLELEIFVDSDFANRQDALSIGGYVTMLGGGCVAWSSKKQRTVALSTTEAEYIALTEGAKEMVWLRRLLKELGSEQTGPTSVRSDNLGSITLSHDATYHARTKHINVAYHFIRERIASNEATVTYVQSEENLADVMTKALDAPQHKYLMEGIGFEGTSH